MPPICHCSIVDSTIRYCHLHDAAGDLHDAIHNALPLLEHLVHFLPDPKSGCQTFPTRRDGQNALGMLVRAISKSNQVDGLTL